MEDFTYHRPAQADAAVRLRAAADDGAYLAGGMTLLPTLKQRLATPTDLIDLGSVEGLAGITREGDRLVIGAMTRHADVAASALVRETFPALAALAGGIGDKQVRNRGTMGGSVANSDPAADYPAAVLALDARISTDRREIAADDFFQGLFQTALEPGELITAISFAVPRRAAYAKFPHPASRYALAGVFVADFAHGPRVAVTGAGPCAFRCAALERAGFSPAAIDAAVIDDSDFNSDLAASAEYRAALVKVMAKRAVQSL